MKQAKDRPWPLEWAILYRARVYILNSNVRFVRNASLAQVLLVSGQDSLLSLGPKIMRGECEGSSLITGDSYCLYMTESCDENTRLRLVSLPVGIIWAE